MRETKPPFWQTEPCPAWCERDHADTDHPDDRTHSSRWDARVVMSLEPERDEVVRRRDERENGERPGAQFLPEHLAVYVQQGWRETDPRVWVGRNESNNGHFLTRDEAEQLRAALETAVSLIDGGAS